MNMINKNKVLLLVAGIVLFCGSCLAVILISHANVAMAAEQIQTAEAEASESAAVEQLAAEVTASPTDAPQATAVNTTLSADALSHLVQLKEMRREYIIPSLGNVVVNEADTWKTIEPDNASALREQALTKTADFAQQLFGYALTDTNVKFAYCTDTSQNRADFVQITTADDAIICTLTADTMDLIEIDYDLIPAQGTTLTNPDYDYKNTPDSDKQIAEKVATVLGDTVSEMKPSGGGGGNEIWTKEYALTMEGGKLAKMAVMNGGLYAVAVYPSAAAMQECVYFDADVQMDQSIVQPASEQNFAKGEPGAGDMTQAEAQEIYQTFLTQAGGAGDYDQPKMTFYIDNSGDRENYWNMEGQKLTMDISSKSKWIISLTCSDLWNSERDLTAIAYESMGGDEYAAYVAGIMTPLYGKDFKEASNNAVYDYHYCTEDAWMADGSVYEFYFADGKLREVWYFADEDCFRAALAGWKADNQYVNSTTGEMFIPN
jgi:hypothetical protein